MILLFDAWMWDHPDWGRLFTLSRQWTYNSRYRELKERSARESAAQLQVLALPEGSKDAAFVVTLNSGI